MRLVCLLMFTLGIFVTTRANWCDEKLKCEEPEHTKGITKFVDNVMCTYKEEQPDDGDCKGMAEKMADNYVEGARELQNRWLAFHNTVRDTVASGKVRGWPSAAGMKQLVWDQSLAEQAKRFNFQCYHFDNWCGKNPNFKVVYFTYLFTGDETLNTEYSSSPGKVTESFITELVKRNANLSYPSTDTQEEIGKREWPFMQIFYGKASKIGASYVDGLWKEKPFVQITTFYGEDSRFTKFYKQGQPCSRCPRNYECVLNSTYRHLCAKREAEEYRSDGQFFSSLLPNFDIEYPNVSSKSGPHFAVFFLPFILKWVNI